MPAGQKRSRDGLAILRFDPETFKPALQTFKTFIEDNPTDAEKLADVKQLMDRLQGCCEPAPTLSAPATNFDTVITATEAVGVKYDEYSEKHLWKLREQDISHHRRPLAEWAGTAVRELRSSPYFKRADSESTCRTMLDVIFCDRLKCLDDDGAEKHLNWFPKVSLSVKSKVNNFVIQGRADWCLAYGSSKAALQTALIVLEAKKLGAAQSALPQLIIYLAAAQDCRKASKEINSSVFGLISDSEKYIFAWLDEDRNLFVSRGYFWRADKVEIIQWIDNILRASIEASPHTTPVKTANTAIHAYQSLVNQHFQFGGTDMVEAVEGGVLRRYRVVKKCPLGELLTEMETDEE